jgi:transcription elongation factor Elf1
LTNCDICCKIKRKGGINMANYKTVKCPSCHAELSTRYNMDADRVYNAHCPKCGKSVRVETVSGRAKVTLK